MAFVRCLRQIRPVTRPFIGLFIFIFLLLLYMTGKREEGRSIKALNKIRSATRSEKFIYSGAVENTTKATTTTEATPPPEMFSNEVRRKLKAQNPQKVIVLSVNPRSGSSYLSELLSSPPMTSYWQEPIRFLFEKPPMRLPYLYKKQKKKFKIINDVKALVEHKKDEPPKDPRYRKHVPESEKVQMLSSFFNCRFVNYTDILSSQVSRQFVFKLPEYALGKRKGFVHIIGEKFVTVSV